MRDRLLIFAGLGLFVVLITYPVWHGLVAGRITMEPDIAVVRGQRRCVAPRIQMRTEHMIMLMQWRDAKVRGGQRRFKAYDGTEYAIDLTATCLNRCHGGNHERFCDRCHSFAGVPTPDCWNCHAAPLVQPAALAGYRNGGQP
jgi:hypothetical protein